jgi:hypothetical protein
MARGSKKKYTSKQKRKASKIERSYKKRGVSSKEAERRAWATVNKSDRGGRKKGGGGRGKKRSKSSSHKKNIAPAAMNMMRAVNPTTMRDSQGLG